MCQSPKRLMILGAGENQLPLIKASKRMGYYTIVCDIRQAEKGICIADKHILLDYTDRESVLLAAKNENIDGIISNSEPAMLNVAYVSQELNLPGNRVEAVESLLIREKFRKLQKQVEVFAPESFLVASLEDLLEKARGMKYPIIIKPAASSGTRGTTKLSGYDESMLCRVYEQCRGFSRNQMVIVEEYVEMRTLRVNDADIFVVGEEILWDGTLWEDRAENAPMLPRTEIFPMVLKEDELNAFKNTVRKIIKGAGVTLGEYNVETYFTEEHEVFVIEINPRQAGNHIPQLIQEHTGIDMEKLLVSTAVSDLSYYEELKTFKRRHQYITGHVVFAEDDGIYVGLEIDPEIKKYIQWIKEEASKGEYVRKGVNAADAVAFVDLKFDSFDEQHRYTDHIERYISANIKAESKCRENL